MDWKMGLFILQGASTIISIAGFTLVKFNDLRHLKNDFEEKSKKIDKIEELVIKIDKNLVTQKAICNERHK